MHINRCTAAWVHACTGAYVHGFTRVGSGMDAHADAHGVCGRRCKDARVHGCTGAQVQGVSAWRARAGRPHGECAWASEPPRPWPSCIFTAAAVAFDLRWKAASTWWLTMGSYARYVPSSVHHSQRTSRAVAAAMAAELARALALASAKALSISAEACPRVSG